MGGSGEGKWSKWQLFQAPGNLLIIDEESSGMWVNAIARMAVDAISQKVLCIAVVAQRLSRRNGHAVGRSLV